MNKMCCLLGKDEYVKGRNQLGYLGHKHGENIENSIKGIGSKMLSGDMWLAVVSMVMNFWIQ